MAESLNLHASHLVCAVPLALSQSFTTSNATPSFPRAKNYNLPGRHVDHAPRQGLITAGGGEGRQFIGS